MAGTVSAAGTAERTFEDLLKEARTYRDELAAAGAGERLTKDRLRLRLGVGSEKALEVLRVVLKQDGPGEASEASGAVS